jgi:hypothetical protein
MMSCFKLPAPVCKNMKSYISNYWCGSSVDSNKIHWQRWSKLTTPKGEGGMGFRDLPSGFTISRYTGRYTAILGLPGRLGS